MRITGLIILISILFSCNTEVDTEKSADVSAELTQYIREKYQTTDVSSSVTSKTIQGKDEKTVLITVGKSPVIDQSKSDVELFASDIALRLYSGMKKGDREKYSIFAVKINRQNHQTETRYKNKSLQETTESLLWLEKYFRLINDKDYSAAKLQFDSRVDTTALDLETLHEELSFNLGKLKNRELQGFIIGETTFDGKPVRALRATYILFYEKHYVLSHYMLLMDQKEQKLTAIDLE